MVVEGADTPEGQQQVRIKTMAALRIAGLNTPTKIAADEKAKRDLTKVLETLKSVGFDVSQISDSFIDLNKLLDETDNKLDPSKGEIREATFVIAPETRIRDGDSKKYISIEDLVPLSQIVNLTRLIRAMRAAMIAA